MYRTRAERRHFLKKAKRKARWMMKYMWGYFRNPHLDSNGNLYHFVRWEKGRAIPVPLEETIDPRSVGINASTHCRPCSCFMCKNEDKHTKKELVEDMKFKEQLGELDEEEEEDEFSSVL